MSAKVKILLVDDKENNLKALAAVLDNENYQLLMARSGKEAIRYTLMEDDIAFIILDVQMPGMDGFETAELIQSRTKTANIPFIFLTAAFLDEDSIDKGYQVGAFDYILKPVLPAILKSKVAIFVRLFKLNQEKLKLEVSFEVERSEILSQQVKSENKRLSDVVEVLTELNQSLKIQQRELSDELKTQNIKRPDEHNLMIRNASLIEKITSLSTSLGKKSIN